LSLKNSACSFFESFSSDLHQGCPVSDNDVARARTSDAGSGIDATIPSGIDEQLVLTERLFSEKGQRATFWSECVLVGVAGDRGNTGHSEVINWRVSVAIFSNKWVDVRAKAAVTVAANSPRLSKGSNLLDIIIGSESVLGAGHNQSDGVLINTPLDTIEVSLKV